MAMGWLWIIVFWGLIIWAVYALMRPREPRAGTGDRAATALEILERRYASGEINDREFEERRRRLIAGFGEEAAAKSSYPQASGAQTPSGPERE